MGGRDKGLVQLRGEPLAGMPRAGWRRRWEG